MMKIMIFVLIILFINKSHGIRRKPFDSDEIRSKRDNPNIKTIFDEFIVFFDVDCLSTKRQNKEYPIEEFLNEFVCYARNLDLIDQYSGVGDDWIVVNRIQDCDIDNEKEVEFDEYCIVAVDEDEEITLTQSSYECVTRNVESALWNLDSLNPSTPTAVEYIEYDPLFDAGIDIIVMDSGIDISHSEFDDIIISTLYDFDPDDESVVPHGTHVTGIIVGYNYGAFRATNTPFVVYELRMRISTTADALNGWEAIISHLQTSTKKAIINMSFGVSVTDEGNSLLEEIRDNGGIIFASAGNDNKDASSKNPASSSDVITVGALDTDNTKAVFSNYGSVVDIWAPGVDILSAVPNEGTFVTSGTSMATPLVAGIAANILALNTDFEFDDVKNKLLNAAIYDVNDENGLTNQPRVQSNCQLYARGYTSATTMPLKCWNIALAFNEETNEIWLVGGKGDVGCSSQKTKFNINDNSFTFDTLASPINVNSINNNWYVQIDELLYTADYYHVSGTLIHSFDVTTGIMNYNTVQIDTRFRPSSCFTSLQDENGNNYFVFVKGKYASFYNIETSVMHTTNSPMVGPARRNMACISYGTVLYAMGGKIDASPSINYNTIEIYTIASDEWTQIQDTLSISAKFSKPLLNFENYIFNIGGEDDYGEYYDNVDIIDPINNNVDTFGHIDIKLGHTSAISINEYVYIFGGRNENVTAINTWRLMYT